MLRKLLVLVSAGAAIAAPVAGAHANHSKPIWSSFPRGDLLVTFSGTGGGGYRYHQPAGGTVVSCHSPDTSYDETDAYSWRDTFVVGPGGGTSDTPITLAGAGQLAGSVQLGPCSSSAASTSTCSQSLRPPSSQGDGDLAYPGVTVVLSGRLVTIGALSELLRSASPACTGDGALEPNIVQGYTGLQASVSFPRALLLRTGDYKAPFTIGSSGLYTDVALSGSCNSTGCDTSDCSQDLPGGGGPPSTCNFGETYGGTIEVRVIR
jgi:hypothetical protein